MREFYCSVGEVRYASEPGFVRRLAVFQRAGAETSTKPPVSPRRWAIRLGSSLFTCAIMPYGVDGYVIAERVCLFIALAWLTRLSSSFVLPETK